jgi:hypothetical protein
MTLVFAVLFVVNDRVALATEQDAVCEDSRVRVQGHPDPRWLEPITRACDDLRVASDSDSSATVRIVPNGPDLVVEVTLADGRSAVRRISDPSTLEPTLEALLETPPAPRAQPTTPAPAPARTPDGAGRREPSSAPPESASFGVEIGGSLAGRIAGSEGYFSPAPSAFAQLRARTWLFGMSARWDFIQLKSDVDVRGFEMETTAVGLALARRFSPSFGNVDVGVSPRLLEETQSYVTDSREIVFRDADVRLAAFARSALGHGAWRFFLEADAELSTSRVRREVRLDPSLPPLPAWSAGLGLGLQWSEQ